MTIKTLIIGKNSNLSHHLLQQIEDSVAISARSILSDINLLEAFKSHQINIIFNNFQTSVDLDKLEKPVNYISSSILATAKVLEFFGEYNVNKVIYTSSSSVYGNNILCSEDDDLQPLNLHAALKLANEKLVGKFCSENNIDYTITRIFNMYGGDDSFSVISKILSAIKNNQSITIANHGNAIRDFMHIDDVVNIYTKLLNVHGLKIVNVGSGIGQSVNGVLDFLRHHDVELDVKYVERKEIKISTACNKLLMDVIGKVDFVNIEDYLTKELKLWKK